MPNGRSGGFPIETIDLRRLVEASPESTPIGLLVDGDSEPRHAVAVEIVRLLEKCSEERVAVEEQDRAFYIVHISNEPIVWVSVDSKSPIFVALREFHGRWNAANPNWKGWIGF